MEAVCLTALLRWISSPPSVLRLLPASCKIYYRIHQNNISMSSTFPGSNGRSSWGKNVDFCSYTAHQSIFKDIFLKYITWLQEVFRPLHLLHSSPCCKCIFKMDKITHSTLSYPEWNNEYMLKFSFEILNGNVLKELATRGFLLWISKPVNQIWVVNEFLIVITSETTLELCLSDALSPQQSQGSYSEETVGDCECTASLSGTCVCVCVCN